VCNVMGFEMGLVMGLVMSGGFSDGFSSHHVASPGTLSSTVYKFIELHNIELNPLLSP
jgi:hypothetical protein